MRIHVACLSILVGCETKGVMGPSTAPVADGVIEGRVCDDETNHWVEGVLAYVNLTDDDGVVVETLTTASGPDGRWSLAVPGDRTYTVYEQRGTDVNSWDHVAVPANGRVSVSPRSGLCLDVRPLRIAIVDGDFDQVERPLARLGLEATVIDGRDAAATVAFLGDAEAMSAFDVIFLESGIAEEGVLYPAEDPAAMQVAGAVQTWVDAGGRLFVGDWSYDLIEGIWPDRIDFLGKDDIPDGAQLGEYDHVEAIVTDDWLGAVLGTESIEAPYEMPAWAVISAVSPATSQHLTGRMVHYAEGPSVFTLASVPVLVSFSSGTGRVTFDTMPFDAEGMASVFEILLYAP